MDVPIDALDEQQVCELVMERGSRGQGGWIITANLDHLRRVFASSELGRFFRAADLVVADGMPLIWASGLQRTPLPERVAGSNLIWSLSTLAASAEASVFLLGGNPGTAERAATKLRAAFPTLRIAGTLSPPLGFERNEQEIARIRAALIEAQPEIVFVGLPFPKQEELIMLLRPCLAATWFLGCGISLGFVSGEVRRAPLWLQRLGLEWVHRLRQEPRRLFPRYILRGVPFAIRLLLHAVVKRLSDRTASRGV